MDDRVRIEITSKREIYLYNGNLSKVVRPNQYNPQADDGAGYQYTYDHQGRVLTVTPFKKKEDKNESICEA